MSVIVAVSGGKASFYCAWWVLQNFPKENVVLYFNDTKWEHPDLYRFLNDIEKCLEHKIIHDNDGRSPEDLFYQHRALANQRMPFCSRILKAERLQRYYKEKDILVFGISKEEMHRANRIIGVYQIVAVKTGKYPSKILFPLITENIEKSQIDHLLKDMGIVCPLLYKLGFKHNNCSGGCVRAGKKQWKLLYETLPEVYLDRERVENSIREYTQKDISFFKGETLTHFRERVEKGELSRHYNNENECTTECIGVCNTIN